jgi:hypothetical protein
MKPTQNTPESDILRQNFTDSAVLRATRTLSNKRLTVLRLLCLQISKEQEGGEMVP